MVPPRAARLSAEEIRDANTRYHDVAADHYDAKWGIDFGEIGRAQVLAKVRKALGGEPPRCARSLEIGSGTGYFTLNLLRAGVIGEATCSDISPGMLAHARAPTRERLGLEVAHRAGRRRAAAVRGRELRPRARPRGAAPHPRPAARLRASSSACSRPAARSCSRASPRATATGSRACPSASRARSPRCGAGRSAPRRAPPSPTRDPDEALERVVDVHAFAPGELHGRAARRRASRTCASPARSCSRTGSAGPTARSRRPPTRTSVPWAWRQYAYRGYLVLQELDRRLLESRLPPAIFYNLMLTARKPRRAPDAAAARVLDSGACPRRRSATSRCSRWASWRCRARACRCTSSRTATAHDRALPGGRGRRASSGSSGSPTRSSSRSAAPARSSRCSSGLPDGRMNILVRGTPALHGCSSARTTCPTRRAWSSSSTTSSRRSPTRTPRRRPASSTASSSRRRPTASSTPEELAELDSYRMAGTVEFELAGQAGAARAALRERAPAAARDAAAAARSSASSSSSARRRARARTARSASAEPRVAALTAGRWQTCWAICSTNSCSLCSTAGCRRSCR